MKATRARTASWLIRGIVLLFLAGCAIAPPADRARDAARPRAELLSDRGGRMTLEELDQLTNGFADRYFTHIVSAIERILAGNTDPQQIRRAQQVRLVQMNAIYDIVTNADPLTQIIDLTLVVTLQS